jgi:hypothetical protein
MGRGKVSAGGCCCAVAMVGGEVFGDLRGLRGFGRVYWCCMLMLEFLELELCDDDALRINAGRWKLSRWDKQDTINTLQYANPLPETITLQHNSFPFSHHVLYASLNSTCNSKNADIVTNLEEITVNLSGIKIVTIV